MRKPARPIEAKVLAVIGFAIIVFAIIVFAIIVFAIIVFAGMAWRKSPLPVLLMASAIAVGIRLLGAWITAEPPRETADEDDLAA